MKFLGKLFAAFFISALIVFLASVGYNSLISESYGQELQIPEPTYNLEYTESYEFRDLYNDDYITEDEFEYNFWNPEQDPLEVRRDVLRSSILRDFEGCIFTPIAIDDRYFGCKFNFEPREVRANLR